MSEHGHARDAIEARIADLTLFAKTQGYDSIEEREVPGRTTVYDLMRGGRIVGTFTSLDRLELSLGPRR
jgi:hypothetical protein